MKNKGMVVRKVKFACERLTAKKMNRVWAGKGKPKPGGTEGQPEGNFCICGNTRG